MFILIYINVWEFDQYSIYLRTHYINTINNHTTQNDISKSFNNHEEKMIKMKREKM